MRRYYAAMELCRNDAHRYARLSKQANEPWRPRKKAKSKQSIHRRKKKGIKQ